MVLRRFRLVILVVVMMAVTVPVPVLVPVVRLPVIRLLSWGDRIAVMVMMMVLPIALLRHNSVTTDAT